MEQCAIGVDLGATKIAAALVTRSGRVLAARQTLTLVEQGAAAVIERIAAEVRALASGAPGEVVGVGVGSPGLVDSRRGIVQRAVNMRWDEVHLARRLSEHLGGLAVRVENDANAAAVGEQRAGAARGERDFIMVTLGTGVGGGLLLAGELVVGEGGLAGELGHLVIDPAGPPCGCGGRGCLEQYASATAAMRRAAQAGLETDLVALTARARAAEGAERALLHAIGRDLGRGLAAPAILLDLRCFVIGGGFGAACDLLSQGIIEGLLERTFGREAEDFRLLSAALGPEAGWIGAATLGRESLARP
jgi:glucokinase